MSVLYDTINDIMWSKLPAVHNADENFETCLDFYFWALETFFVTLKIRKNNPEIANLEFESHGFLKNINAFMLLKRFALPDQKGLRSFVPPRKR